MFGKTANARKSDAPPSAAPSAPPEAIALLVRQLFDVIDSNSDDAISRAELKAALGALPRTAPVCRGHHCSRICARRAQGRRAAQSRKPRHDVSTRSYSMAAPTPGSSEMMDWLDASGDGFVSVNEFWAGMKDSTEENLQELIEVAKEEVERTAAEKGAETKFFAG